MITASPPRFTIAIVGVVALVFASCSGGSATSEQALAAIAEAAANEPALALTDDLAATELLDTRSGQVTSLKDVVTGDRAVLLWYWAPN